MKTEKASESLDGLQGPTGKVWVLVRWRGHAPHEVGGVHRESCSHAPPLIFEAAS